MKYMLLVYGIEEAWSETERAECMLQSAELCHELDVKGEYLAAAPLHSVTTATSIRMRDNKRVITDGPFAETTEQLGGYFLIDVPNLDAAIQVASRVPAARLGTVEIRPVVELAELPTSAESVAHTTK